VRDEPAGTLYALRREYVLRVVEAGGAPLILPHEAEFAALAVDACDGIVLSGGDDPDVREFGFELHPRAELIPPLRQRGELAILRALDASPETPVLGICLGMQLMGLHAGGRLIQHLDDELAGAERHRGNRMHGVESAFGAGEVASCHHQALGDAGALEVVGRADDGVIEAVRDPARPFAIGVQWHPERTADPLLGAGIFRQLVEASRRRAATLARVPPPSTIAAATTEPAP